MGWPLLIVRAKHEEVQNVEKPEFIKAWKELRTNPSAISPNLDFLVPFDAKT
jgi:hypothetical protein